MNNFWKVYAGVITIVATGLYTHIRLTETWVAGFRAALEAQDVKTPKTKPEET